MTDFRNFEGQVMVALYQAWQDGNTLASLGKVLHEAGLEWQSGWLVRVHDSLSRKGYLHGPANRRIEEMTLGGLTPEGLQYVEDNFSLDDADMKPEIITGKTVDSSTWTGLPSKFVLTDEKRAAIVKALDNAEEALPKAGATQHDQAQARAYIVAARTLLEAPDPEVDMAWQLIGRADNLAGIASLLVAIVALFAAQ